jgi:hypothetical protein
MIGLLSKNSKNSPVWNDLLKVRHVYLKGRSMVVGNGKSTSFWHDRWCGLVSLADKFPDLYKISNEQDCSVEHMKLKNWRWLHEDFVTLFFGMASILRKIRLNGIRKNLVSFLLSQLINIYVDTSMAQVSK